MVGVAFYYSKLFDTEPSKTLNEMKSTAIFTHYNRDFIYRAKGLIWAGSIRTSWKSLFFDSR